MWKISKMLHNLFKQRKFKINQMLYVSFPTYFTNWWFHRDNKNLKVLKSFWKDINKNCYTKIQIMVEKFKSEQRRKNLKDLLDISIDSYEFDLFLARIPKEIAEDIATLKDEGERNRLLNKIYEKIGYCQFYWDISSELDQIISKKEND